MAKHPLDVDCPHCKSKAGDFCNTVANGTGANLGGYPCLTHKKRWVAAIGRRPTPDELIDSWKVEDAYREKLWERSRAALQRIREGRMVNG